MNIQRKQNIGRRSFLKTAGIGMGSLSLSQAIFSMIPGNKKGPDIFRGFDYQPEGAIYGDPVPFFHKGAYHVHVSDFGAYPDDGVCDTKAINNALRAAIANAPAIVYFDPGEYIIRETATVSGQGQDNFILLNDCSGITLSGATNLDGTPATRLSRQGEVYNDINFARPFMNILNTENLTIENFIISNDPEYGSSGEVVFVDKINDIVDVEVFPGLLRYDNMKCYSANAWDIETKRLLKIPAVTIGMEVPYQWRTISGGEGRRLRMTGAGFSSKLNVGDGLSWHIQVGGTSQVYVLDSANITFQNIVMHNALAMGMLIGWSKNLTFKKVRFEPEGYSLAVGARDGIHLSGCSGTLLIEECYFKGLRWDPINVKSRFCTIYEVPSANSVRIKTQLGRRDRNIPSGRKVVFWSGDVLVERTVSSATYEGIDDKGLTMHTIVFTEPIPSEAVIGSKLTPLAWTFADAIIKDTVFTGNCGGPIILQNENFIIDNCIFDNNTYALNLGPVNASKEGGFARNIVIRNTLFNDSAWVSKHNLQKGMLTISCFDGGYTPFICVPYNQNITITNNVFKNMASGNDLAIYVKNAQDVLIKNNTFYSNVEKPYEIDLQCNGQVTVYSNEIILDNEYIADPEQTGDLLLFPIPGTTFMHAKISNSLQGEIYWHVIDSMGRQVLSGTGVTRENMIRFDISGLMPGIYFFSLISNGHVLQEKFIAY